MDLVSLASLADTGWGVACNEDPHVPNHGQAGRGLPLNPGLVIAIEPIATQGAHNVDVGPDGWTVTTRDRSLAAHFEHTVFIGEDGPEVLTALC